MNECSCFRLYPIDKTRVNEFGQTFDEDDQLQTKKEK